MKKCEIMIESYITKNQIAKEVLQRAEIENIISNIDEYDIAERMADTLDLSFFSGEIKATVDIINGDIQCYYMPSNCRDEYNTEVIIASVSANPTRYDYDDYSMFGDILDDIHKRAEELEETGDGDYETAKEQILAELGTDESEIYRKLIVEDMLESIEEQILNVPEQLDILYSDVIENNI